MSWYDAVRDPTLQERYAEVQLIADWSEWLPFETAQRAAPREPGAYLLREPDGTIRYVGMAGERAGPGRPQGLHGRLAAYRSGSGAVNGFGGAALDRALADADWVEAQLRDLRARGPRRASEWARDAIVRLGLEVSWAVSADRADAVYLEKQVVTVLGGHGLWDR